MSNHDLYDLQERPENNTDPTPDSSPAFDPEVFSNIFEPDGDLGYEFEQDNACIYTAPSEGAPLPQFKQEQEAEPQDQEPLAPPSPQAPSMPPEPSPLESIDFTLPLCQPEDAAPQPEAEDSRQNTEEAEDEDEDEDDAMAEEHDIQRPHIIHILLNVLLGFLTFFSFLYLVAVYSDNTVVVSLRNMYIQTAMSTLNHKYLATAIFPSEMIDDLMRMQYESEHAMVGVETQWGDLDVKVLPTFENETTSLTGTQVPQDTEASVLHEANVSGEQYESEEEATFFELFYEIDYRSMHDYLEEHPQVLDEGWANIEINRSALGDEGTSIQTIYGDQVLALNAQKGIVLVRVNIDYSRGVFAICKDTSKLHLRAASTIGAIGQTAGRICDANGGILGVTGNAFIDPNGEGNGGTISGLGICNGTVYGQAIWSGYKRVEFRSDNKMYIMDSGSEIASDVRDAVEFTPALIIDGNVVVDETSGWNSPNPRTAIGQTSYLETILVVVEGRFTDSPGCSVVSLAEKLQQYGCVQAMNLDGGTSAIMYYDGCYVTRCSNSNLPSGRPMPTAWVYG